MTGLGSQAVNYRDIEEQISALLWTSLNFLLLVLLVVLALLKEDPVFWRNAGGWPVWLREFVGSSFYFLFFVEFLLLSGFSLAVVASVRMGRQDYRLALVFLPILWLLLSVVVGIVSANNIGNLIAGRPLHWHPY